jgi:hypothetical protein
MAPRTPSGLSNPFIGGGSQHPHDPSSAARHGSADFQEIKTITLEWKLTGLAKVFEQSRGETKSRCLKSTLSGSPSRMKEDISS